ncbi:MAG TPA: type II CAAX endopeptidase family protein [Longimicrobiales bacterium]|nr:type II CAAX endopeptidase family protein [Longimicrobiales bacterium]
MRLDSIDDAPADTSQGSAEVRTSSYRLLALMCGLIVGWGLLMQHFEGNIYGIMGPFALSVVGVIAALFTHELRRWLRPSKLALLSGLGVGVAMTLLTYPLFFLARATFPGLGSAVSELYATAQRISVAEALPWVVAIIIAEELLWRGALLQVLSCRVPDRLAMVLSVLSYALAQFGSGSWIVMLLAAVCGSIWTLQRRWTHSLVAPLISHIIWTTTVVVLHPVTDG